MPQKVKEKSLRLGKSLGIILVVAFCARAIFLWDQQRKIPSGVLEIVAFQNEAGNIGQSLALGNGFGSVFRRATGPTAWLTPVYPPLLAGIFKCFGIFTLKSFFVAAFLNITFSTAACVPIFYAGKRIAGISVASATAWLWALFPNAIVIPFEWIWDTCLSALLLATILWATIALTDSRGLRNWCSYGLLCGLALMTNPALASLLPFLLGWAAWRAVRQSKLELQKPVLALGIAVLCCVPWTLRNYIQFHRFVPLRSNFPFELWMGNNDIFDLHAKNAPRQITQYEEIRQYGQLGENAFFDLKWNEATHFIRAHPGLEADLTRKRILAMWTGVEHPIESFLKAESNFERGLLLVNGFVAIGAALGIIVLYRRRSPHFFPLAVIPVVFPGIYYVTHASLRFRHVIDPVVLLLTVITMEATIRFVLARRRAVDGPA